jgi:hypothetical protein
MAPPRCTGSFVFSILGYNAPFPGFRLSQLGQYVCMTEAAVDRRVKQSASLQSPPPGCLTFCNDIDRLSKENTFPEGALRTS